MPRTYAEAGVDQDKMNRSASTIIDAIKTFRKGRRTGFGAPYILGGHFAGLVEFGDYALSLCTDGVGTKILIASAMEKYDTIGIDAIAMNVNDMICIGAEPMAFVDYLAMSSPDENIAHAIGIGLGKGAEMANIEIIGGETAILPDMVNGIDLSGTALGYVRKDRIITGDRISSGDLVISLASSGFHSNGYTLVRKVVEEAGVKYDDDFKGRPVGEVLLEPTIIYVHEILSILEQYYDDVHGMANITGGGVRNLNRLKKGMRFVIDSLPKRHDVFDWVQELGGIEDYEMFQTFNMGMGFAMIVSQSAGEDILKELQSMVSYDVDIIGHVEKADENESVVIISEYDLKYEGY